MKKHYLLLLPVLLIAIIAFVVSCVRNQDAYWDSPDLKSQRPLKVADAQQWFEKEYDDAITVVRSLQNDNTARMVSYAESVFAGKPDWTTARPFRKNGNSLIVTLDYLNPKSNYRGFRDIIIIRNHKREAFNAFVQLQLFDTSYLNNQIRIKGERANIREYSDPATFTGKVYKYSINNEFIRGAIYKNGKMVARVFPKNKISSLFKSPSSPKAKSSYVPYNGVAVLGRTPSANVSKSVAIHLRSVERNYEEPPVRMAYNGEDSTDTNGEDTNDTDEYDTYDPDSNMETVVVTAVNTGSDTDTCEPLWGDTCGGDTDDDGGGDPYPTDPCTCGGGGGGGGDDSAEARAQRLQALLQELENNPDFLYPCGEMWKFDLYGGMYLNVAQHVPSPAVLQELEQTASANGLTFETTYLENAEGYLVNMDFFPIRIDTMPSFGILTNGETSKEDLLEHFRTHMNLFVDSTIANFRPLEYGGYDGAGRWNLPKGQSIGTILNLDMINDGDVVLSGWESSAVHSNMTVSTLFTTSSGSHPVQGSRRWGVYTTNEGYNVFYTMGVDRISTANFDFLSDLKSVFSQNGFADADDLWRSMQFKMVNFINENGGTASIATEGVVRTPFDKVSKYLDGEITLDKLKQELGCQ